jgi:DNA-binding transcriptional LysR family regulator
LSRDDTFLDSLGALSVFVRVAEAGSFTEAGRNLSLSSSAIGKVIARLEERLGVRLFHRSTRRMALTPEGQLFLESCRRIIGEMEAIGMELAQTKAAPKGKLRVSLPLLGMLFMPTLSRFMQAYPEIELDLDFSDHLVDVIGDGFDVVIRTGESGDSRLTARDLGTYQLLLVASPAYFKRAGVPQMPEDLLSHACLHHKFPTTGKLERWPLMWGTNGNEPALPTTASASTMEPLITLAEMGLGITCMPDFCIRRQLADGSLVSVLEDHTQFEGVFRAVWPSSRFLSPKRRVFVDFLAEHLFPKR